MWSDFFVLEVSIVDNSPVLKEKVNGLEALGMLTFLRSYSKGSKENWGDN
jgi:hypothetical protein